VSRTRCRRTCAAAMRGPGYRLESWSRVEAHHSMLRRARDTLESRHRTAHWSVRRGFPVRGRRSGKTELAGEIIEPPWCRCLWTCRSVLKDERRRETEIERACTAAGRAGDLGERNPETARRRGRADSRDPRRPPRHRFPRHVVIGAESLEISFGSSSLRKPPEDAVVLPLGQIERKLG